MKRFVTVFGALLVMIIITTAILEIGLRLIAPGLGGQIGVVARYITSGQPYAETWTQAWQENRDHYYTLKPNINDALQYGSPTVSFRLTTHKLWDDGLPPDQGIGFRNPPVDYAVDGVVVGDSFGFCFNEIADCWVTLLAQNTGLNWVNLSQPVTGSISHAKMLADFGAPLEPPLVLWQFFGNDFNDDYGLLSWRGDIEPMSDDEDTASDSPATLDAWLTRNSVTYALLELIATGRWSGMPDTERVFQPNYQAAVNAQGDVLQFGKLYERRALDMSRPANQFGLEQTRAALEQSQALVETWGGRMVVVIIPTREEVYETLTAPLMGEAALDKHRSARLAMLDLCESLALTCIDPTTQFQALAQQGTMLYYSDDMHLNAAGNRALADVISAALAESRP